MAGAGYKLFNTGDVLTAAQVNTYLQEQAVMRFANSTARTTALSGVLAEGMMSYLDDTNSVEVYNGSAWVSVGSTGDITGVTAGTGISGGGSSGDVTITNSMATAIDAKGDLIVGTGADTFSRLAVGTNGHTLVADSAETTGLKWAAPAGGGKILQVVRDTDTSNRSTTSITFTDVTGVSVTITPTLATSSILIIVSGSFEALNSTNYSAYQITNGSNTAISGAQESYLGKATIQIPTTMIAYDSPATTSAITYKLRFKVDNASTTNQVRGDQTTTQIIAMEIGA